MASQPNVIAFTGIHTFLGRNLIQLFDKDETIAKIIALDRIEPAEKLNKVKFYHIDLTQTSIDRELVDILKAEKVSTLVHLAFLSSPSHESSWAHELEAIGTTYVLNACEKVQLKRFIMRSTTAVYGASPQNPNFLTEDHPLNGSTRSRWIRDKIDAEKQVRHFRKKYPGGVVTVLRLCPIMGPTTDNYVKRYLRHQVVPVILGFDPLFQFIHESDAIRAFKTAILNDHSGEYNIVGDGVMPISIILKLLGRIPVPLPYFVAQPLSQLLWEFQLIEAAGPFLDFLRYVWIADGTKALKEMGFKPLYSSKEALLSIQDSIPRGMFND